MEKRKKGIIGLIAVGIIILGIVAVVGVSEITDTLTVTFSLIKSKTPFAEETIITTFSLVTGAVDTSFTVTLPSGYDYAHFNLTGVVGASTEKNVTPEGQADDTAFYNVTNTGNTNLTVRMSLNNTVADILLKADTDNSSEGAKEVNASYTELYQNLTEDESVDVWLFSDLDHAAEQETNRTLEVNVTES